MKATKSQPNESAAALLERARAEYESAQHELQSFNVHKGGLDAVASRRRELLERVEIGKERLRLAEDRAAEIEFSEAERRIDELQEQSRQIEGELSEAREQAAADLRQHLNPDWLAGSGRYSSQRPALGGLLGYCNSVSGVEGRRDAVLNEIRRLENRIAERRAARDRDRRAAQVEGRKKLIGGECVAVSLTPWRIVAAPGFTSDVADSLDRKHIPAALVDQRGREIHALLPPDSQPGAWCDSFQVESAAPLAASELCPALAAVWQRATPPKKRDRATR